MAGHLGTSFIDIRFRPEVQLQEAEIRDYYTSHIPAGVAKRNKGTAPSLDEARPEIETILTAQHTENAFDRWLGQTRRRLASASPRGIG